MGCEPSLEGEPDFDKKINRFQGICGNIRKHLKRTRTDTQMKLYKVVARPSLLYGSETWVTTNRDMTRLEAAEMLFLRSVAGYTRLDKIRNEAIRKELEISGIEHLRLNQERVMPGRDIRGTITRATHRIKLKISWAFAFFPSSRQKISPSFLLFIGLKDISLHLT